MSSTGDGTDILSHVKVQPFAEQRQYNTFISQLSDAEYWSEPWESTHALYFTTLNTPEPRKFVKGSKHFLQRSFIMILKTYSCDYVLILLGDK